MTLGQQLRKARKKLEKTQSDIASAVGVTQPTVHAWESDVCLPEAAKIRDVAKAYDVDPLVLLPRTTKATRKAKANGKAVA